VRFGGFPRCVFHSRAITRPVAPLLSIVWLWYCEQTATTADGRTYYWNKVTNETTYDMPAVMKSKSEASAADWQSATAPDGRTYYYNTVTNETTYTKPPGFGGESKGTQFVPPAGRFVSVHWGRCCSSIPWVSVSVVCCGGFGDLLSVSMCPAQRVSRWSPLLVTGPQPLHPQAARITTTL
jgi:hypothetical protein